MICTENSIPLHILYEALILQQKCSGLQHTLEPYQRRSVLSSVQWAKFNEE
jgi:hypothetical protein